MEHSVVLDKSHFDSQLLSEEKVLWIGQPHEIAFHQEELRLANLMVWLGSLWSLAYGSSTLWQHGLPYSYSHGGVAITVSGFAAAILIKFVSTFSRSSAGRYWYAVTDKRIFAEIPDEGSQTTIIVNLSDITQISLKRSQGNS